MSPVAWKPSLLAPPMSTFQILAVCLFLAIFIPFSLLTWPLGVWERWWEQHERHGHPWFRR